MEPTYEIDLDSEKVFFDGNWLGGRELAEIIKTMVEGQDFRVGAAGKALEVLQQTVSMAQGYSVKLSPEEAESLEYYAACMGLAPAVLIRRAVLSYLASVVSADIGQSHPSTVTAITTEPVEPGEAMLVVPLTEKKSTASATGRAHESYFDPAPPPAPIILEEKWFKKS